MESIKNDVWTEPTERELGIADERAGKASSGVLQQCHSYTYGYGRQNVRNISSWCCAPSVALQRVS